MVKHVGSKMEDKLERKRNFTGIKAFRLESRGVAHVKAFELSEIYIHIYIAVKKGDTNCGAPNFYL